MTAQRIELTAWECTELLRSRSVGRICVIDHGYPLAIPVNYQVSGSKDDIRIVVRTAPSTIVGRYGGLASLEVDEIALADGTAWSVILRGTLHAVAGPHELADPNPIVDTDREHWMTLSMSAISGRRFSVRPAPDGFAVHWQPTAALDPLVPGDAGSRKSV